LRDFGQNASKRKRYEVLRNRLKEQFRPTGTRSREIVNAPEFEAFLSANGFTIVDPEK